MNVSPLRCVTINIPHGYVALVKPFYEHVLGLKVGFDHTFTWTDTETGGDAVMGVRGPVVINHLIHIRQDASEVGMIGFNEFVCPNIHLSVYGPSGSRPCPLLLSIDTNQLQSICEQAPAFGGTVAVSPQTMAAKGTGTERVAHLLDPVGLRLSLSERPEGAGQSRQHSKEAGDADRRGNDLYARIQPID